MAKNPEVKPIPDGMNEQSLKSNLLSKASTILKARHVDEFEAIATELFAEYGLERVRKLTEQEKDEAELQRLAEKLGVTLSR